MTKKTPGKPGPAFSPTIPTGLPSDYKADQRILAPIPGVVTEVFVRPGEQVSAGDPLLVIDAMKMRNIFRSRHTLHVAAVYVKPGQVVKAGELMVEFELPGENPKPAQKLK